MIGVPGFTADVSLPRVRQAYAGSRVDCAAIARGEQSVIPQALYCCILRRLRPIATNEVIGCRGHNAWHIFAAAACSAEAVWHGASGTLVPGRCSDRAECRGKIW